MKPLIALLATASLLLLVHASPAAEGRWTQWPVGREDYEPSLQIPPGFRSIPPLVRDSERMLLNGRFRSADGTVEFAVAALHARGLPGTVRARAIALPLLPGERIIGRTPSQRAIRGENGDYHLHDEEITVKGPKDVYTRYFRIELSTSSLPGASSLLWEFKAASDQTRKTHQRLYRQFKDRVNLGED